MSLSVGRICQCLCVVAALAMLSGCGETPTSGGGVVVVDAGLDAVSLADADTADVLADSLAELDGDAATGSDADAAVDPDTDAVGDSVPADVNEEVDGGLADGAPDGAVADAEDATATTDVEDGVAADLPPADVSVPDDAPDTLDAPDVSDIAPFDVAVPQCASAADCGGATPYCSPIGTCVTCNFNLQCPGNGAFCVNNACKPAINCASDQDCTAAGAVCDTAKGVCRACLATKDCAANQVCTANQCQLSSPCASSKECPGALVCAASQCVECGADTDCLAAQFCDQGLCVQDACKPGSHCEGNAIATCQANGGGWDYADCGLSAICLGANCTPVVCTPLEVTCQSSSVASCNDTGTQLTVTACPANQTCVGKVCVDVVCPAKSLKCDDKGGLLTCSDDGTQWLGSACAPGNACASGVCQPQICTAGATLCSGQQLLACTAFGLSWGITATCSDSGQVCATDKCVDPLCKAGSVKCEAGALATCNSESNGWTPTSCADGDACTTDGCDPGTAKCSHEPTNCDDGNSCTLDTCSNGCQHAGISGPTCDDGNACSTGETCNSGKCVAPIASATVSTIAGSGAAGSTNGAGSSASFGRPYGLARLPDGSMASTDYDSNRIRQIQADGTVSTLAGTGSSGSADGPAASATFYTPTSLAVDKAGTVFIADYGNSRLRALANGTISTFAGSTAGFKDGVGAAAQFSSIQDIKFDGNGVLWAADRNNHRIRRITADGTVTTAAGTGVAGFLDGTAGQAQFNEPCRIAPAPDGSVYVADCSNYRIRRLSADGLSVSTVSGSGIGYIDGPGSSAKFAWMGGLTWVGGTLIVSDNGNNRIRAVAQDGTVSTLAGSGSAAYVDGAPSSAAFSSPWNVAVDWSGALWLADGTNQRIRKLTFTNLTCDDANPCTTDSCGNKACVFTPVTQGSACSDGTACTSDDACSAAGKCVGTAKACVDGNPCTADTCNPVSGACMFPPTDGPCIDNDVCTNGEHCVGGACLANVNTLVTVAGAAASGSADGAGKDARFNAAFGLALTKSGAVYVGDAGGNRIRLVTADGTTTTVAGTGTAGFLDGTASTAQFNNPTRLALDSQGAVLIADSLNNRIRKLSGTTVSTVAGSGTTGFLDGSASSAQFSSPFGLVYSGGIIYVADSGNHRIRTIAPNGTVGTLAGSGTAGYADGPLASATFSSPRGLCQASDGTLYVVDTYGNNIRRIANGQVTTLAGGGPGANDGIGLAAGFNQPRDCTVDASGNVYVTDTYDNRLRRITPSGVVTTLAGTTIGSGSSLTGTDGNALTSVLAYPAVPAWAPGGTIWLADNNAIRKYIPANVDCGDGLPCTTDVCNGVTGACTSSPSANGAACDDGKLCLINESCTGGVCGGGTTKACDDNDKCTIDSCDAKTGCQHAKSSALPGCCNPYVFQTGFENDGGNGITLTTNGGTTMAWSIGAEAKVHGGSGAMAVTTLNSDGTITATLPAIALPPGAATLSFWLYYDAVPDSCGSFFGSPCGTATFNVLVNGVQVTAQTTATNAWTQVSLSSPLVGSSTPSIQLVFATAASGSLFTYNYASSGTGVFVDDILLTSTCQ